MQFISTRDSSNKVTFQKAVLDCIPQDGGLYVFDDSADLRRWILYSDENTSFASLAGALTSAMINDEFSPIICETIASHAFPEDPVLRKLDDNLYILELYHGATGTFKDFGVSYLTSAIETMLQYNGEKSILLDATTGELGACMAHALRGKKFIKSVLLYPKGKIRGLEESDFVWNGGNIYPVEIDGTIEDCHNIIRKIFANRELVEKYHLTVANTANIGRLLPQAFFYTFAFSRIKKQTEGDIFYTFPAGNYGNLVSALYGWKMCLPVNGFIVPSTPNLTQDVYGKCMVVDSVVPLEERTPVDPSDPSNIERFEHIFKANNLMMKSFVFPASVSEEEKNAACKELYVKYKVFADSDTAASYAASMKHKEMFTDEGGALVILARESPCLDSKFLLHNLGEEPAVPENVAGAFKQLSVENSSLKDRKLVSPDDIDSIVTVLNSLNLLRLF